MGRPETKWSIDTIKVLINMDSNEWRRCDTYIHTYIASSKCLVSVSLCMYVRICLDICAIRQKSSMCESSINIHAARMQMYLKLLGFQWIEPQLENFTSPCSSSVTLFAIQQLSRSAADRNFHLDPKHARRRSNETHLWNTYITFIKDMCQQVLNTKTSA